MAKQDWFKEIGLSYCENFDEVETARTEFLRQRDSILAYLSDVAGRAIADAKLKVLGAPQREDGWDNWPLGGRWTKIRSKLGKKSEWQSGIYFGIDHDPCFKEEGGNRFGFCACLFFAMSQERFGKLRHSLANAAKARHGAIDFWPGDDSACVRIAWIRPGASALAKNDPGVLAESDPGQRVSRGWYGSVDGGRTSATTMHGVSALVRARSIGAAPVRMQ